MGVRHMEYDPNDHILTGRRVIGAWVACLAILGTVFVAPVALHRTTAVVGEAYAKATAAKAPQQLCQRHIAATRG